MKYYYANAANQATGPVSVDDLARLLAAGTITLMTNVIAEGSQQWHPLSALPGFTPTAAPAKTVEAAPVAKQVVSTPTVEAPQPVKAEPVAIVQPVEPKPIKTAPAPSTASPSKRPNYATMAGDLVGFGLNTVRPNLSAALVERVLKLCQQAGDWLVLCGASLVLLFALMTAIKSNSFVDFLFGIGAVLGIAIFQYISKRFSSACSAVSKNTYCSLSSTAAPDCIALFMLLAALLVLVGGIIVSVYLNVFVGAIAAIGLSAILALFSAILLNPSLINLTIRPSSAGEEAMGWLSMLIKAPMIALPLGTLFFAGAGVIVGLYSLVRGTPHIMIDAPEVLGLGYAYRSITLSATMITAVLIKIALILPVISYVLFLFFYLFIDVIRSIVCLPGKLDALRQKSS